MGLFDETPQYQQPVYTPFTDPARKKQRMLLYVIVGGILLLIFMGIFNAIRSGTGPKYDYAELAAQQNELLRLVQEHDAKARGQDLQNYMARAESVLLTGKSEWTEFLASRYSFSITPEQKALVTNTELDEDLKAAHISNRFDETFREEFSALLDKAERQAQRLLEGASSEANTSILNRSLAIYQSL